ncbi:MAG: sulfotransferase [Methyloceanibacter sp.]
MQTHRGNDQYDGFRLEPWIDWLGGFVTKRPGLLRGIGDFETRRLGDTLDGIEIRAPIFVCGLARSGSTVLLECLAEHPDTANHCYRDYPGVLAPILWDRISSRLYADSADAVERAHGDGITVTPESPEAMEEMIWMAFHPDAHDPGRDNSIGRGGTTRDFAQFYRDHIRKLLWLRGGERYLSKGNYNLARLGALIGLFPDARFIVPVRDPVAHIASLQRQHALFCAAETAYPSALRYMQRVGHFEFGLDRRPLNLGNTEVTRDIQRLWREGREVEGLSLYWADVHEFIADSLEDDPALRNATLLVPFEELCQRPVQMLAGIFGHCGLSAEETWMKRMALRIRAPHYYRAEFEGMEIETIRRVTALATRRLGYRDGSLAGSAKAPAVGSRAGFAR